MACFKTAALFWLQGSNTLFPMILFFLYRKSLNWTSVGIWYLSFVFLFLYHTSINLLQFGAKGADFQIEVIYPVLLTIALVVWFRTVFDSIVERRSGLLRRQAGYLANFMIIAISLP